MEEQTTNEGFYTKTDEEFYAKCAKNLEELHTFPISHQEKRNLHFLIYETMERYIENQQVSKETEEKINILTAELAQLGNSFYGLISTGEEVNRNLKELYDTGKITLINMQINTEKINEAARQVNQVKEQVEETANQIEHNQGQMKRTIETLEEKLDAKTTLLQITREMTHQKKE